MHADMLALGVLYSRYRPGTRCVQFSRLSGRTGIPDLVLDSKRPCLVCQFPPDIDYKLKSVQLALSSVPELFGLSSSDHHLEQVLHKPILHSLIASLPADVLVE